MLLESGLRVRFSRKVCQRGGVELVGVNSKIGVMGEWQWEGGRAGRSGQ